MSETEQQMVNGSDNARSQVESLIGQARQVMKGGPAFDDAIRLLERAEQIARSARMDDLTEETLILLAALRAERLSLPEVMRVLRTAPEIARRCKERDEYQAKRFKVGCLLTVVVAGLVGLGTWILTLQLGWGRYAILWAVIAGVVSLPLGFWLISKLVGLDKDLGE